MDNVFEQTPGQASGEFHGESNSSLSVQLNNAIADRDRILEEMMETQNEVEKTQRDLEYALREVKSAKDLSTTLKDENELLNNEIAQLKNELTATVTQSKNYENQVVDIDTTNEQAMAEKQAIIDKLTACNEALTLKDEMINSLQERYRSMETSLREKETAISHLTESITALNATIEQKTMQNENLDESIRLMKKSNQSLIQRTDSQLETMQSLQESNEALSAMLRSSKCKLQLMEKDLKQTEVDKNILTEVRQENNKLRNDSKILKERIKKSKTNENVKAVSNIRIASFRICIVLFSRTKSQLFN